MNNKVIGIVVGIIFVCLVGVISFVVINNNNNDSNTNGNSGNNNSESNNNQNNVDNGNTELKDRKVLVVYFSAQNHTREVAKKIADNLSADIFEIEPVDKYTSEDLDWTNDNSRVSKEHNNESLRNVELVSTKVENWENYDTVLIGYPIWWGVAGWPVNTFVKENDFSNKTVIPFCTSASSGLGQSGELLKQEANSGNWLEGHRFSSNPTDTDIKTFTDSIK